MIRVGLLENALKSLQETIDPGIVPDGLSMGQAAPPLEPTGHWVHDLDPVMVQLGPIPLRYYSLAYILGLVLALWLAQYLARRRRIAMNAEQASDMFLFYGLLGIIIGGRLGYVFLYDLKSNLENPANIIMVWKGGMASHGGIVGVAVAFWLFARRIKVPALHVFDVAALTAPIGLCLGRVANFINGELWGRPTDVSWGVIFPAAGHPPIPRHPSQLYEALGEGLILFLIALLLHRKLLPRTGALTAIFLMGYSIARIVSEQFREPDRHIGLQAFDLTRGQILTFFLVAASLWVGYRVIKGQTPSWTPLPEEPAADAGSSQGGKAAKAKKSG